LAAKHFQLPSGSLAPDDDFFKKLGIDSLQTLEMLSRLENHFGIELPDYEVQGVSDFKTLAERIQSRLLVNRISHRDSESRRRLGIEPATRNDDLTGRIIGRAMEVHRHLGPGLLESIYESALAVEFEMENVAVLD